MKNITIFCCVLLIAAAGQAKIIHVPGDYPTIQQGINAANSGDTVLVAEGTYFEQINFLGKKPLMVASQFLIDSDTNHITNTIIDGSKPSNPDSASVVYFVSGEDTTSILCGFTITGGTGTTIITPHELWGVSRQGGGIWISGSSAKIRNNIITRNRCEDINRPNIESDIGGGIATDIDSADYWIVIDGNVIDSNYVISDTSAGCCTGAGIAIINNCRIINNIIKNNVSKILVNTIWWSQGAGACIFSIDTALNQVGIIQNNQFLNNINNSNKAYGGGMKAAGQMHFTISNNTFIGNRVESDITLTNSWGGGLETGNFLGGSVISNNIFTGNYSESTCAGLYLYPADTSILVENNYFFNNIAEGFGGAIGSWDCPVIIKNNVFSGNHAGTRGGALFLTKSDSQPIDHFATLINNSFSGNIANNYGGAIYAQFAKLLIFNSIFWNDSAFNGQEIFINAAYDTVEIAYSNIDPLLIQGNKIDGGGNINVDPLFANPGLLTLNDFSPCKNAGTEVFVCHCGHQHNCPHYDITGLTRPLNGGFDMGAYEDIMTGFGGKTSGNYGLGIRNYPDPIIESTTFSYTLKEPSRVTLQVFNSFGQLVDQPVNAIQPMGDQKVLWNAVSLPSGLYFYHIQAGGQAVSGKMIKY